VAAVIAAAAADAGADAAAASFAAMRARIAASSTGMSSSDWCRAGVGSAAIATAAAANGLSSVPVVVGPLSSGGRAAVGAGAGNSHSEA
jgi:hypothetical protein